MLRFRSGWAAVCLPALWVAGCADLTTPQAACGDGVVESDEDCDELDAKVCGQPSDGATKACRFLCDGATQTGCPSAAWSCGLDGVCRQAMSPPTWTVTSQISQSNAVQLLVADFDSDGVDDIVGVSPSSVSLHFSEQNQSSTAGPTITAAAPQPSVGVLPGAASGATYTPGAPSLVLDINQGLGVFTGAVDRTLTPVVNTALSVTTGPSGQRDRVIPFVIPMPPMEGQPLNTTALFLYNPTEARTITPPDTMPVTIATWKDTLTGTAVTARFKGKSTSATDVACNQIAIPLNGALDGHVNVYDACAPGVTTEIILPGQICTTCAGPVLHVVDVDFDGYVDLMIVGESTAANVPPPLYVAYSDGLGGFGDTPGGLANGLASASLTPQDTMGNALAGLQAPLAVGDLNGDCIMDFVDPLAVWISTGATSKLGCIPNVVKTTAQYVSYNGTDPGHPWSQAVIADMNDDKRLDVVVSSTVSAGVTIFRGTDSTLLDPFEIVTSSPVKGFAVGDFDGDLVPDVIMAESGPPDPVSGISQDPISVSFGAISGPPTDAADIGVVPGVAEIFGFLEEPISPDAVSNGGIVAYQDLGTAHTAELYLFVGNTARQMDAPFLMIAGGLGMTSSPGGIDVPVRSVIGTFTGRKGLGDMAAIGKSQLGCTPVPSSCPARLWIVPTLAGGTVAPAGPTSLARGFPLPSPVFEGAYDMLLANVGPPSGSAYDTLVLAAADTSASPQFSNTLVLMAGDGSGNYNDPTGQFTLTGFDITDGTSIASVMFGADVDGDGHVDLVIASPTSGLLVMLAHATSPAFDGTSTVKTIPYTTFQGMPCAANQPNTLVEAAIGATALPAPIGSKAQPLLVVVPEGTLEVQWDAAKGGLGAPACVPGLGGGLAVATGDFNGDRILDVVLSQANTLDVYYGDAVPAGGVDGGAP